MTSTGSSGPPPAAIPPAETPITNPNLSLILFSGSDPNQVATTFWKSVENKILFSLGARPTSPAAQTSYEKQARILISLTFEVENTFRQEGELIKNYLHRMKWS